MLHKPKTLGEADVTVPAIKSANDTTQNGAAPKYPFSNMFDVLTPMAEHLKEQRHRELVSGEGIWGNK